MHWSYIADLVVIKIQGLQLWQVSRGQGTDIADLVVIKIQGLQLRQVSRGQGTDVAQILVGIKRQGFKTSTERYTCQILDILGSKV